jgi:hypothetical protein
MNTISAIQQLLEKLIDPRRHEDEGLDPDLEWLSFEPAWLDHYLMHRDARSSDTMD